MTQPDKDKLVVRDELEVIDLAGNDTQASGFNAAGTWINAVEAVEAGCNPKEVAAMLNELLDGEEMNELSDEAPVDKFSEPVLYNSATARLCWAIGEETGDDHRWAPKVFPVVRHETGS